MNLRNLCIYLTGLIILILVLFFIGPFLTMITWNFVMPYLFNLPTINFWMAMAIDYLAATLFKSYNYNPK